jgi:carbonic anhydrase
MEYSCKLAGSKLIVVLGHSHCGAIIGACNHVKHDHLNDLLHKIKPAVNAVECQESAVVTGDNNYLVQKVANKNVELTAQLIRMKSPLLTAMESNSEIAIVVAMYDIKTGKIKFNSEKN